MPDRTERVRIAVRANLRACAEHHGIPEGYGPSYPQYQVWASERGRTSGYRLAKAAGYLTGEHHAVHWPALVRWALLEPAGSLTKLGADPETTRQAIIEDLRRVARGVGKPDFVPAPKVYRRYGQTSDTTARAHLTGDRNGSWHDVAIAAGLTPNRRRTGELTRAGVMQAYRRAAKVCGYRPGDVGPSTGEFQTHTGIHPASTRRWFARWNDLAEACGYERAPVGRNRHLARRSRRAA